MRVLDLGTADADEELLAGMLIECGFTPRDFSRMRERGGKCARVATAALVAQTTGPDRVVAREAREALGLVAAAVQPC